MGVARDGWSKATTGRKRRMAARSVARFISIWAAVQVLVASVGAGGGVAQEPSADGGRAIERGISRYEEADFEGAQRALTEAENGQLTRAQVVRLLAARALVHFALGQSEALDRDLAMLASIAPDYRLGERVPPAVREAFAQIATELGGTLDLRLEIEPSPAGTRVHARVEGDRAGLVRRVVLAARHGDGAWQQTDANTLVVPITEGVVEAWAEARGPGSAVLAAIGSAASPTLLRVGGEDTGGSATGLWIGLGAGAATVIGVVVVALVLSAPTDETTRVLGPTIER